MPVPLINLSITPIYAAILTIVFVVLSLRVIRLRRKLKIGLGMGSAAALVSKDPEHGARHHETFLRAVRVHSNFAEYVPLGLILLLLLELCGAPLWRLHAVGIMLLLSRLSHAYGVSRVNEVFKYRVAGMALMFTGLLSSAIFLILTQVFKV
jgi:uncharacterized protein